MLRVNGGVLPVNGDQDSANEDDTFVLRLNAADSTKLEVLVNFREQFTTSMRGNRRGFYLKICQRGQRYGQSSQLGTGQ